MAVTADKPAPYAPASAILDLISRHRSRGLPTPINAENLVRVGIPESLVPRTLQALGTLDLINENGAPTPIFEGIRLAAEAEYKKRLEDWLKGAYADAFSVVDPATDDETRIRDAFRSYQPIGQQNRMVILFQGLCAAAGLIPDKPSAPRSAASASPRPRAVSPPRLVPPKGHYATIKPKAATGMPPALSGLLESLPAPADGWTQTERNKFYTTFGTVLDFYIPIRTASKTKENDGQE